MAVKLRLVRIGKKKQPTYRLVAADSRSPRNGRFIEIVGTYAPRGKSLAEPDAVVEIDNAKAVKWLSQGAQPTERVEKLLKQSGALDEFAAAKAATVTDELTAVDSVDDVNTIDDEFDDHDDDAGNRVSGGTPLAVVTYLVNAIASDTEAVVINTEERGDSVRFRIHVAPEDMGRVIGRRGRVAQAIRTVVAAAGARDGVQTSVDIVDD